MSRGQAQTLSCGYLVVVFPIRPESPLPHLDVASTLSPTCGGASCPGIPRSQRARVAVSFLPSGAEHLNSLTFERTTTCRSGTTAYAQKCGGRQLHAINSMLAMVDSAQSFCVRQQGPFERMGFTCEFATLCGLVCLSVQSTSLRHFLVQVVTSDVTGARGLPGHSVHRRVLAMSRHPARCVINGCTLTADGTATHSAP
jgi:hypothetical protein